MSEELIQKKLTKHGIKISKYEYFDTTRTNINAFKKYGFVPNKVYGKYGKREPDGLLIDRGSAKNVRVIVAREYKQPKEFRTEQQKLKAIQQCNDLCQVIEAQIGVITDGQTYIWINPRQQSKENFYLDRTTNKKRSYTIVMNEDKKYLSEPFDIQSTNQVDYEKLDETSKNTLYYVERVLSCVDENNSILKATEEVDPLKLAQSVWQDIYINTAKSPIKCLYNVVELFIFKFLSDLKVLKDPYDFDFVYQLAQDKGAKIALDYYAKNPRKDIKEKLFPAGTDATTIINGTIFVTADGRAVDSQANLFKTSLEKYKKFGSLKNIKKEFKTKLFETFLKQSSERNKLGQFFTPRKVVKAIVDIADVEKLKEGSRVCDPFCGVGGFIAETIQKPVRKRDYFPNKKGEINPKVTYLGFDKGTDEDDERIIILAKANMLIYLSDIIEKHPNYTQKFSKVFNDTFHFLTASNLGTLKEIFEDEDEKFDLILTNPPYVTSGVTSIRDEIKAEGLEKYYTKGGKGVDGLALEWIIRSLKKGGRAFIVLPSGIFNTSQNKELRKYLSDECFINGIISLPAKTFFNTPQKTYILCVTKKEDNSSQDFPVFTYLVSNIGETLNIYRFENEGKSDLEKAKDLFNAYKGSPNTFPIAEIDDPRCKLQPIEKFLSEEHWVIDKWWTKEEKISLGIEQEEKIVSLDEFKERLEELVNKVESYTDVIEKIKNEI